MKNFLLIIIIVLTSCSLNKNSSYWNKDQAKVINNDHILSLMLKKADQFGQGSLKSKITTKFKKDVRNNTNQILTNKDFMKMSIKEYNLFLEEYLENSDYPEINN